ncbi:RidA family protein [Spirosoma sp. 209]|uniref:RidA family protein n=1 Tax=Spirosoma sp. 209 TaxID=1955701 RepID=UPI00098D07DC|nr:RidA family protein [Spirosoma sp. 209]
MKKLFILLAGVLMSYGAQAQAPTTPQPGYIYKVEPGLPGKQVYVSGQRPFDGKGRLVGAGDLGVQTRQIFENLKAALGTVGMSLDNVTQVTYHVKDQAGQVSNLANQQISAVGASFFTAGLPKISDVKAIPQIVSDDVLIEVEVIAIK